MSTTKKSLSNTMVDLFQSFDQNSCLKNATTHLNEQHFVCCRWVNLLLTSLPVFFFACTTESIFSWFNHIIISKFAHFACVDKTNKKRLYTRCHRIGAMYLYNNNQKKNINLCKHSLCYVENVQKPAYHVIVVTGNTCVRPVHSYTYRPTTTFI